MARKFKITKPGNDWLFIDKYAKSLGYISYRHLIEHSLFVLIQRGTSKNEVKQKLIDFIAKFDEKEDITDLDIPLKIYFFKSDTDKVAVVDGTKFCFPLICDVRNRPYSFKSAIYNIYKSFDSIYDVLEKNKDYEWSEAIQKKLDDFDDRDKLKVS